MAIPLIERIEHEQGVIGRRREADALLACLWARRHVLIEGPVGVGKTVLAKAVAAVLDRGIVRLDGDGRYTEARLVGQFDPPVVLARGYQPDAFLAGPLVQAMQQGAILFLNELNRMPEGVQNVLLPALDERQVIVPRFGLVEAAPGFAVIATQNPAEFVATGTLSEALRDRFELVRLDYQSANDEQAIVAQATVCAPAPALIARAVALTRATRNDPRIRRGASVRAAIAMADIATELGGDLDRAAELTLPTRIELLDQRGTDLGSLLDDLKKKVPSPPAS